ncbi:hypothetical protein ACF1BN_22250 [Streptomyces sp. NPDC014861]|uniref:hypothetical protein n=1 Tax=Streptomyces sp. NPDC014861 TaxID=3364923 RepID=UPI0037001E0C
MPDGSSRGAPVTADDTGSPASRTRPAGASSCSRPVVTVLTSVAVTGTVAGALGVPLGMVLHGRVVPAMADSVGLRLPASVLDVYGAAELVPLALGGLLIAVLGALLPAGWAARTRTATALRTE